jgi:RNA polymerase sigma factor (sigma-70 family)
MQVPGKVESRTGADCGMLKVGFSERIRTLDIIVGRFARDRDEADDLLQEIWLRALQRWGQYDGRGAVDGWLFAIALNVCRAHVRSHRRRRRLLEVNGTVALLSDGFPPPDEDCGVGNSRIMAAFKRLPRRYQAALWCRVVEGNSNRETAERMNCPMGTVKALVSRGLVRLRREFQVGSSSD